MGQRQGPHPGSPLQAPLDLGGAGRFQPQFDCLAEHAVGFGPSLALARDSQFWAMRDEPNAILFNYGGEIRQVDHLAIAFDPVGFHADSEPPVVSDVKRQDRVRPLRSQLWTLSSQLSSSIPRPVAAEGFGGDAQRREECDGFGLVGGSGWIGREDLGEAALETGAFLAREWRNSPRSLQRGFLGR